MEPHLQHRFGGLRIAVLMDEGTAAHELAALCEALEELGATAVKVAQRRDPTGVDLTLQIARSDDFDALVAPGASASSLADNADAQRLARDLHREGKPVAAIGHGIRLLTAAGLVDRRRLASPPELATAVRAAGGRWVDTPAAADGMLVSGRGGGDSAIFVSTFLDVLGRRTLQSLGGSPDDSSAAAGEDG
jgi:protease I